MQVVKILTVLMVVVAMGSGMKNCRKFNRPFNKQSDEQFKAGVDYTNPQPQPTFVTVPPQQGLESIRPNIVSVPRCLGLRRGPKISKGDRAKTLTFKVEGYADLRNMKTKVCLNVNIKADVTCHYECDKSLCSVNQTMNIDCTCTCDQVLHKQCLARMANGELVMWDIPSCTCPCNKQGTECSTGYEFDMNVCRCRSSNGIYE